MSHQHVNLFRVQLTALLSRLFKHTLTYRLCGSRQSINTSRLDWFRFSSVQYFDLSSPKASTSMCSYDHPPNTRIHVNTNTLLVHVTWSTFIAGLVPCALLYWLIPYYSIDHTARTHQQRRGLPALIQTVIHLRYSSAMQWFTHRHTHVQTYALALGCTRLRTWAHRVNLWLRSFASFTQQWTVAFDEPLGEAGI